MKQSGRLMYHSPEIESRSINSAFVNGQNIATFAWMYQRTLPQACINILITFCEITKPPGHCLNGILVDSAAISLDYNLFM